MWPRALHALASGSVLPLVLAGCGEAPAPPVHRTAAPELSAVPTPAAPTPAAPTPAASSGPRLAFEETVHDFGSASDVRALEHAFAFTNTGDRKLVITEIKASCGCTATTLAKKVFEPGESDRIEVDWHPKGHGDQRKSITVQSNSVGEPLAILYIDARIEPFVSVDPEFVNFGRVRLGEQRIERVRILCADPELLVESVVSQNPHFTGQVVKAEDGGLVLELVLKPSAPWGQLFTTVELRVVGRLGPDQEPIAHKLDVSANARVFGDLEPDPSMFAVGRVDPGGAIRYEVKLVRSSPEPFQVLDVRVEQALPPGMSVRTEPLAPAEGNGFRLVLEGHAGEHVGAIRGQVHFSTDVPGESERSLAIMGLVRALDASGH